MNDTLKDLSDKRKAVANDINDLFDAIQIEIYKDTIIRLKEQIKALKHKERTQAN